MIIRSSLCIVVSVFISTYAQAVKVHKLPIIDQPYGHKTSDLPNKPQFETLIEASSLDRPVGVDVKRSIDSSVAILKHCSGYFPGIFSLIESKLKLNTNPNPPAIKYELNFISNNYNAGTVIRECFKAHREISKLFPTLGAKHRDQVDAVHSLIEEYRRVLSPRFKPHNEQAQQDFDQKLMSFINQEKPILN